MPMPTVMLSTYEEMTRRFEAAQKEANDFKEAIAYFEEQNKALASQLEDLGKDSRTVAEDLMSERRERRNAVARLAQLEDLLKTYREQPVLAPTSEQPEVKDLKREIAHLTDRLKDATARARHNRVALYHADTTLLAIGAVLATAVDDLMNLPGAFTEDEDGERNEEFVSVEEHIQAARGLAREERDTIKDLRDGVTLNIITGEESEDAG